MEYYSARKKNDIMPFAAKWMDPEIIILLFTFLGARKQWKKVRYLQPASSLLFHMEVTTETG